MICKNIHIWSKAEERGEVDRDFQGRKRGQAPTILNKIKKQTTQYKCRTTRANINKNKGRETSDPRNQQQNIKSRNQPNQRLKENIKSIQKEFRTQTSTNLPRNHQNINPRLCNSPQTRTPKEPSATQTHRPIPSQCAYRGIKNNQDTETEGPQILAGRETQIPQTSPQIISSLTQCTRTLLRINDSSHFAY